MQNTVVDAVLEACSLVRIGLPVRTNAGLSVLPLLPQPGAAEPSAMGAYLSHAETLNTQFSPSTARLVWKEEILPHPARVIAWNPGPRTVVVDATSVLDGGMSTRALRHTTVVPAASCATVAVEAIGARWWDEGSLYRGGRLEPLTAALLFQGVLGGGPAASSARTALRSLHEAELVAPTLNATVDYRWVGWMITDEMGVVAAWLAERDFGGVGHRGGRGDAEARSLWAAVPALVASLREGLERDRYSTAIFQYGRSLRDVVVVPRDFRLVDRLVAACLPCRGTKSGWMAEPRT